MNATEILKVELRISRFLLTVSSAEAMARGVVQILRTMPTVDAGGIYLHDREKPCFRLISHWGLSEDFVAAGGQIAYNSSHGRIICAGKPFFATDTTPAPDSFSGRLIRKERLRAGAVFPILYRKEVFGSLNVASRTMDVYPKSVEKAIRSIGRQIGLSFSKYVEKETLRRQHADLSRLVSRMPAMLFVVRPNGQIQYVNAMASNELGYAPCELMGRAIEELFSAGESRDKMRRWLAGNVAARKTVRPFQMERRDGNMIPVEVRFVHGVWDHQAVFFVFMCDRSQQQEVANLRKQEERNHFLFDAINDGIFILDKNLRYVTCNAATECMTGISRSLKIGKKISSVLPYIKRTPFLPGFKAVLQTGQTKVVTAPFLYEDGRHGWYEVHMYPVTEGVLCVVHDISERREMERQVQESVGHERKMLAGLLHDGVAQKIYSAACLCKTARSRAIADKGSGNDPDTARLAEIEMVLSATQEHLRELARTLFPHVTGPSLVDSMMQLTNSINNLYGVRCHFHGGELLERFADDVSRAEAVYYLILEAVMNGIRHGRPRMIVVTLERRGANRLRLQVADDGVGFDVTKTDSCTIGHRLMRYRAERIGGTLSIASQIGEGTRIYCDLPLIPATSGGGTTGGSSVSSRNGECHESS